MPAILYGVPHLPEFEPEVVLDNLQSWLRKMEELELLKLSRDPKKLTIESPTNAIVTIERVEERLDMTRVLLGTRFSLRIQKIGDDWFIVDHHGEVKVLTPDAFYGELKELLEPPGPSL